MKSNTRWIAGAAFLVVLSAGWCVSRTFAEDKKVGKEESKVALRSARLYIHQRLHKLAFEQLDIALRGDPGNPDPHFLVGKLYAEFDKPDSMNYHFDTVGRLDPKKFKKEMTQVREGLWSQHYNSGVRSIQKERMDVALEEFDIAVRADSAHADTYKGMGYALVRLGRAEEAGHAYEKAAQMDSKDKETLLNLSSVYMTTSQPERAVGALEAAALLDPNDAMIVTNLVVIYKQMARQTQDSLKAAALYDSALAACEHALALNPDNDKILVTAGGFHLDRAVGLAAMDRHEEARQCFTRASGYLERAMKLDPNDGASALNLGHCYNQLDRPDSAIAMFRKAVEINPKDVDAWEQLAFTQVRRNDVPGAIESFGKITEADPENIRAYEFLSSLYAQRDEVEKATEYFNKAEELKKKGQGGGE